MVNKILVDTSVLIGLQRGDGEIVELFRKVQSEVVVSRITVCEFVYGSRDRREKKINQDFLLRLKILEVDEKISISAYELIDKYGLKVKFGIADALIAASALENKLRLWTENKKHFKGIRGLKLFGV